MNLRAYKLPGNTAAFDYVVTILAAIALTRTTGVPLVLTTVVLLVVGEIMHYAFGVPTNTLQYLRRTHHCRARAN